MASMMRRIGIAVVTVGLALGGATGAASQEKPATPLQGKAPLAAVDLAEMTMDVHLNLGTTIALHPETEVLDENGSRVSLQSLSDWVTDPPSMVVGWQGRQAENGVVADRIRVIGPLD